MNKALKINREVAGQDYFLNSFSFDIDVSQLVDHKVDYRDVDRIYDQLNNAFDSLNKKRGKKLFCVYTLDNGVKGVIVIVNSTCQVLKEDEYGFDFRLTLFENSEPYDYVFHVRASGGHIHITADVIHRESIV